MKIYFNTRQQMREFTKKTANFKNGQKEDRKGKQWTAVSVRNTR